MAAKRRGFFRKLLSPLGTEGNTTMGGVSKSAALGFYPHLHPFMFSTPTLLLDAEKTLSS